MAIDSCDHGDFVVCYEVGKGGCPVCNEQAEKEAEIGTLKDRIESLESDVESLQSDVLSL